MHRRKMAVADTENDAAEGKNVRVKSGGARTPTSCAIFSGGNRFELDTGTSLFELTPSMIGLPPFLYGENIATL
jgi:hypothetical protein